MMVNVIGFLCGLFGWIRANEKACVLKIHLACCQFYVKVLWMSNENYLYSFV